jgi:hypothetical protein
MSIYPPDLVPLIREAVDGLNRDIKRGPIEHFQLPADSVLELFLNTAYHASFLTEEGHRPGFRLVLDSRANPIPTTMSNLGGHFARFVRFVTPRPFTTLDIKQIAPAAEYSRYLICARERDAADPTSLEIFGLLDMGEDWKEFIQHDRGSAALPPMRLTVTSTSPGELSISSQGKVFLVLSGGRVLQPTEGVFWRGPLWDHFSVFALGMVEEVRQRLTSAGADSDRINRDHILKQYFWFLERVIYQIRERRHGATLLVVPDKLAIGEPPLVDQVKVKYVCDYDHAWRAIIDQMVNSELAARRSTATVKIGEYEDTFPISELKDHFDQTVRTIAASIAALTAVDGALMLTTRFRVVGFGAEVVSQVPSLTSVAIAENGGTCPITSFGTRHRAAFRFCSGLEKAVAFVISQDGAVRAVKRVCSDVQLWPNINNGAFGI